MTPKLSKNSDAETMRNVDHKTVDSFGNEWARFDQSSAPEHELEEIFESYFHIFPWDLLPENPEGFDMGCGSGRWAKFVSLRVSRLNCIDPSEKALAVAKKTLIDRVNVDFIQATADEVPLAHGSQDFGYSLGVLHHIPDTEAALAACVRLLKPSAPFLVYLYYNFDNRPVWFRFIWRASELLRTVISKLPDSIKVVTTDTIALLVYWPLARIALLADILGLETRNFPLQFYRRSSFYSMRTDSRDRFGTPLERRFTREEITQMMRRAGCEDVKFSECEPYWCAVGKKASA